MVKRLFRVLTWLASGVVVMALLGVIGLFMAPRVLGWQLVVVMSGSMEPALGVGGLAFVEPRDAASVKVGDILTFRLPQDTGGSQPGKIIQVSHRVIEIVSQGNQIGFQTKGDANDAPDGFIVPASDVVGTVEGFLPKVGFAADKLRTRQGFLLLIGIPGVLIVLGEVRSIGREIRNLRAKKQALEEANT